MMKTTTKTGKKSAGTLWNLDHLFEPPRTHSAPGFCSDGVQAVFYDGLPWHGKPTRVFAWVGLPERKRKGKVPGMVLVHGGGGTAFSDWVRLWNQRGYAAICMDTCGGVPCWSSGPYFMNPWPRHDFSGPAGWTCTVGDEPLTDQWPYHAVASVVLGHSLLRSFPEVDPDNIGLTGISWGGVLACMVAGVDARFRFAAPVYGCGFLGEPSGYLLNADSAGTKAWLAQWDPSVFLRLARMPMLWVTGTNDGAFPMSALQQSYRMPKGARTLCVKVRMPHAHGGAGEKPEEIRVFADSLTRGAKPLPRATKQGLGRGALWAVYESETKVVRAELNYTRALGYWTDRQWTTVPANLDARSKRVTAPLPRYATVAYLNLIDDRGMVSSTEHVELND
jgi:dienelactone hydrolase